MKERNVLIIKISSVILFLFLAFGLESVYRQPLFDQSLIWIKQWQAGSSSLENKFLEVMTEFGDQPVLIPLLIIVILFFPLNKSYSFVSSVAYSVFFVGFLKDVYGNPRPFFADPTLFKKCDGGYGNPSGHAFSSTAVYLSLWHIITEFKFFTQKTAGVIIRYILLVLFICLIFTICISRVYLGVHSVNQILFGITLGASLYFIIFHILSFWNMKAKDFFAIFRNRNYVTVFSLWFALILVVGFLIWGLNTHNTTDMEYVVNLLCPTVKSYKRFNNEGLFGMLTLFTLIGAHYGLVFLANMTQWKFPDKENEINDWYIGGFLDNVYRVLLLVMFALPILLILIPGDLNLGVVYTFKVAVPYLIALFNIFGPCVLLSIILKVGNKAVHEIITINNEMRIDIESNREDIENHYENEEQKLE